MKHYKRHSKRVTRGPRWKALRMAILERDNFQCAQCHARRGRLEIDHIKPVKDRPDLAYAPENLQTLCSSCHAKKTRIEVGFPPVFDTPAKQAWGQLLRTMQRKPSSNT